MSYIKFNNSNKHIDGIIKPIASNIIEVNQPLNQSGLNLYLDNDMLIGDYNSYTTLYRKIDDSTYQYSNDGSVYVEPKIIQPTKSELAEITRQSKIAELTSQLESLKSQLSADDYIIIKLYEMSLVGEKSTEYDIVKIHTDRNLLRTKINTLEKEIGLL